MVSLILAVHLKEKINVPDVPDVPVTSDTPTPAIPNSSDKLDSMEIRPAQNASEVPSLTEKETRIEDDTDKDDDEEVLGALSESEDELSDDDLLIGILYPCFIKHRREP